MSLSHGASRLPVTGRGGEEVIEENLAFWLNPKQPKGILHPDSPFEVVHAQMCAIFHLLALFHARHKKKFYNVLVSFLIGSNRHSELFHAERPQTQGTLMNPNFMLPHT